MNRYIQSATILFAALVFVGCSKVEEINCNPDSALQIESVGGVSQYALMQAQPASKAVIDGNELPGSEAAQGIGIFVTAQDGSAYMGKTSGYSNVKYTYNGEKWSTATPIYLSGNTGKLYGYFPYNTTATDLTKIPIVSSLNGTDYLYAEQREVSISKKSVSLQMNHALARLHLTLKKGEKYKATGNISKITLKSTAIDATGTMDITTGEVTATKAKTDKGVVELAASGSLSTGDQTYDILLVSADASDAANPFDIIISIDGITVGVTLSGENALDIRSGIQCNATLEIQDTGIKISGIGVGEWGEGGSQEVLVDGHRLTVKFSSNTEDNGIANDVLTAIKVDGSNVMIEAYPKSQKRLVCYLDGVASCKTGTNTVFYLKNPFVEKKLISYIFTISDITSDIIATIGYPRPESINLSLSSFTAYVGCSSFKLSATVLPDDALNKNFTWSSSNPSVATVDENGRVSPNVAGTANITATTVVGGITATCTVTVKPAEELIISGKFSVGSSKYVNFSRGNLYYDGSRYCIEEHQYDTTPTTNDAERDENHISHFTWCDDAANARANKYYTEWDGTNKSFFAAKDFTANDISGLLWFTLSDTQWQYLLKERKTTYGTGILSESNHRYAAVKVKDMAGLLLFPDEFSWPTEAGDEPKTFNTNSSNWNGINYSVEQFNVLQDNGCVFLRAAGCRNAIDGSTRVYNVSYPFGCYWSSSPNGDIGAYNLYFHSNGITPANYFARSYAFSVRLVTDVK